MTITNLIVKHIKGAIYVEVQPDDPAVVIAGNNHQGKSSTLRGIEFLLRGKRSFPRDIVTTGEDEGSIMATLDDGSTLYREIQADGSTKFWMKDQAGRVIHRSQEILDTMYELVALDVQKPMQKNPMEQAKILREVVGVDFSELDARRKELYDERAVAGRDVTARKGQIDLLPFHAGVPEQEQSTSELSEKLNAAHAVNNANAEKRRKLEDLKSAFISKREATELARQRLVDHEAKITSQNESIAQLEAALEAARTHLTTLEGGTAALQTSIDEALTVQEAAAKEGSEYAASIAALEDEDVSAIELEIKALDDTNRKVRENANRRTLEEQYESDKEAYKQLTEQIEAIDTEKAKLLADAPWPIEGLSFSEDGITYRGRLLDECSDSEKIITWFSIALAKDPAIKVFLFREAVFLDTDTREQIRAMAQDKGAQVWFEVVGESDEQACVVIEAGKVKERKNGADKAPVPAKQTTAKAKAGRAAK